MLTKTRLMLGDDRGQGLVEYALIIALIAIVCAAVLKAFGATNNNSLGGSANKIPG
jgi:Flp pilus assembly pilin Flp